MKLLVLVEGPLDQKILELLLGDLAANHPLRLANAGGHNAARPLARKHMVIHHEPVALVLDADTQDESRVRAQQRELEDYLRWGASGVPFCVLQFVPAIEVIFFECPEPLERILGRRLPEETKVAGRFAPRQLLESLAGSSFQNTSDLLKRLDENDLQKLRSHATIESLREFVQNQA